MNAIAIECSNIKKEEVTVFLFRLSDNCCQDLCRVHCLRPPESLVASTWTGGYKDLVPYRIVSYRIVTNMIDRMQSMQ